MAQSYWAEQQQNSQTVKSQPLKVAPTACKLMGKLELFCTLQSSPKTPMVAGRRDKGKWAEQGGSGMGRQQV